MRLGRYNMVTCDGTNEVSVGLNGSIGREKGSIQNGFEIC